MIDEICMLDQMSGGRFMLGIGRGTSPVEVGLWGLDPDTAPAMYAEALEVILQGLATNELAFVGKYYRFDRMQIELEPVQRPHPPLWYGVARPEAVDWCAEHDVNIVTNLPPGPMRAVRDFLRRTMEEGGLNYLLCRFAFGDMAPAEAQESVRLLANEIMPAFA